MSQRIKVIVTKRVPITWNNLQKRAGKKGLKSGLNSRELSQFWRSKPTSWNEINSFIKNKQKFLTLASKNDRSDFSDAFDEHYYETGLYLDQIPISGNVLDPEEVAFIVEHFKFPQSSDSQMKRLEIYTLDDLPRFTTLSPLDIITIIMEEIDTTKNRFVIQINNRWMALTDRNMVNLTDAIFSLTADPNKSADSSYEEAIKNVNEIRSLTLRKLPLKPAKNKRDESNGGFFPYYNTSNIDLSAQQIFPEGDENLIHNSSLNCFVYALDQSGKFTNTEIEQIKIFCKTREISGKKMGEIGRRFNFCINQLRRDKRNKPERKKIGNITANRKIDIGKLGGHFFYNPDDIFFTIEQLLPTFKAISLSDRIAATSHYYKNQDLEITDLTMEDPIYIKKNDKWVYKDYKPTNPNDEPFLEKEMKDTDIWCADFEAYFKKINDGNYSSVQLPILLVAEQIGTMENQTLKPGNHMFESFRPTADNIGQWFDMFQHENTLVYFHNLGYDITQLLSILPSEAVIIDFLPAGSSVISLKIGWTEERKIEFRCSFKLTTQSIAKMAKSYLGSKITKEICPYELFNSETINLQSVPLQKALDIIKPSDHKAFLAGAHDFIGKDQFFLHSFNLMYCKRDVEILKKSLVEFYTMVREEFNMNCFNYLTAPSFADSYFKKEGCFDGVMEFSGIPLLFMQRAIVGGRCMTANNQPARVTGQKILDMDCNSLYPSAMNLISGYSTGVPNIVGQIDYTSLSERSKYYIVEIEVHDIPIAREFPLLSSKNADGVRFFSNDVRGKIVVDKTTLEDAIEFQGLEFTIIRGYYWTEVNPKIKQVIFDVYEKRLFFKKQGNAKQEVFKLIMNSAYGKTIIKPVEKDKRIVDKEGLDTIIGNNFDNICHFTEIGNTDKILLTQYRKTLNHFNRVHCGCAILSMSKRIMNQPMCLAEDLGGKMFYQDTDSMHIVAQDYQAVESKFLEKYGCQLSGKGLGQFTTDFEEGEFGSEAYYLGKKLYAVKKETSTQSTTYHLRAKGIPNCLMTWSDYDRIYNHQHVEKNLLEAKPGIRTTHLQARIIKEFKRVIKI